MAIPPGTAQSRPNRIMQNQNASPVPPARSHPRGLATLFFTEMWERFSYYGMRALLVLFMVDSVQHGGMGLTDKTATAIYGLYTAAAFLACLPGGWLADRLLGAQRSVWYGGIIIAAGHFVLVIPRAETFFIGLMLVVTGTGLLKPNISASLYTWSVFPRRSTSSAFSFPRFRPAIPVAKICSRGLRVQSCIASKASELRSAL